MDAINYMKITKSSAQEVANHFGINNSTLIATWNLKFINGGVTELPTIKEVNENSFQCKVQPLGLSTQLYALLLYKKGNI